MLCLQRQILAINSDMSLVADESGERLFGHATSTFTGLDGRELFSFGNGSFFHGLEAKELQKSEGKNIPVFLKGDTYAILERKKNFAHLADLPCLEKAYPLKDIIKMLEDGGEVNVRISHHVRQGDDIQLDKALVFNLEQLSEKPKKKLKTIKKAMRGMRV